MGKRICVGKISSAHGIKGLVKITPYCEDIALLNGRLYTEESGECPVLDVTIKNSAGKHLLAYITGVDDKEKADSLKCLLFVERDALPELDNQDEFYVQDLIGLHIVDELGNKVGDIKNVDNFGAGDLLEIRPVEGGQTYYIPFHNDFVTNINIVAKIVSVKDAQQFRMD